MDFSKIKISERINTKVTPKFWFHRVKTTSDEDVVFLLKNVACMGISDFGGKKQMMIDIWDHQHEPETNLDILKTVIIMQNLHEHLASKIKNENQQNTKIHPFKFTYGCGVDAKTIPLVVVDDRARYRNENDMNLKNIGFYPRFNSSKCPVMCSEGKLCDDSILRDGKCRVDVLVRLISLSVSQYINCPKYDVIAVQRLSSVPKMVLPLEEDIDTRIEKSLGCFKKLNDVLLSCDAWLSGSYLLQIINNENYENSDIDLFCPSVHTTALLSFFFNNDARITKMYGSSLEEMPENYEIMRKLVPIENIIDIEYCEKKFQIISLLCDDVGKCIDETFDFDFCKVRWNGRELFPKDLTNIINRVGSYDPRQSFTIERLRKYVSRGYTISCDFDSIVDSNNVMNIHSAAKNDE